MNCTRDTPTAPAPWLEPLPKLIPRAVAGALLNASTAVCGAVNACDETVLASTRLDCVRVLDVVMVTGAWPTAIFDCTPAFNSDKDPDTAVSRSEESPWPAANTLDRALAHIVAIAGDPASAVVFRCADHVVLIC